MGNVLFIVPLFRKVMAEGGVVGLWRGCGPNVLRAAFVNLGDLSTYDFAKRKIMLFIWDRDDVLTQGLASLCAG